MDTSFEIIHSDERIRLLATLAEQFGVQVFLVGGCLRDVVMGRLIHDYDFALGGAEENLPAEFASRIDGSFFWLDPERLQARVVSGRGGAAFTYDFAPIRGTGIQEDLALRDFTINALALPITRAGGDLLDPLCGMRDIAEGKVRACGAGNFEDDPLRLLRAVRFSATLGFAIEADTWQEMLRLPRLLDGVAGERIRDELFHILGSRNVAGSLEMLRSSGLLSMIIPELDSNGKCLPDFDASSAFAAEVERLLEDCGWVFSVDRENFTEYLERSVEGGIPLLSLLKLAAFLSGEDTRKRIKTCCDRIRLGTKARAELKVLSDCATVFPSFPERVAGERFLYRFFRDRAPGGAELVVLPLAARLIDPEAAARLVSYYFREYRPTDADLLLSGDQVMNLLAVSPGPQLGRILETLRLAESAGQVSTVDEARDFLLKTVDNSRSIG